MSLDAASDVNAEPIARLRQALAGSAESSRLPLEQLVPKPFLSLFDGLKERLRPAAVLVPLLVDGDTPRVLLTRRAETLRHHKGQISFPGGRRDEGDASLADAALREAHEEVGLPPSQVELIGYLDDHPTLTGFRITPVVGLVHAPFEPQPHAGEVAELIELPLSIVLDRQRFTSEPIERLGARLMAQVLNYGPHRIWGATASILWDLRRRYHGEA